MLRIVILLVLALLSLLAVYFGSFPLTKLTPLWGRAGYFDWPIFLEAAQQLLETGILYQNDLSRYGPSAEIYKFPPFFAVVLAICLQMGIDSESLRTGTATLQLLAYFTSIYLCLRIAGAKWSFFLCVSVFLFLATFEPFIDNYLGLQLEIWILLLLSLCYCCMAARHFFIAGALVGFAVALKLYPFIFILAAFFCERPQRFVMGIAAALLAVSMFTLMFVGLDQQGLYFTQIAPLLAGESLYTSRQNVSINNLLYHAGIGYPHWGGWCLLLLTLAGLWAGGKSIAPGLRFQAGLPALVAVAVLFLKNSWGNYQVLLALPIMVVLAHVSRQTFRGWTTGTAMALYLAGALFFYSPPHRLYFFSEWWLGPVEIPVVPIYITMRVVAGLLVLFLSLGLYRLLIQDALKKR